MEPQESPSRGVTCFPRLGDFVVSAGFCLNPGHAQPDCERGLYVSGHKGNWDRPAGQKG